MLDRWMVCAECTIGSKSFMTHPMEFLGDVGHLESHFGPFGDSISVDARYLHGLRHMYHWLRNCFGLLGDETQVKSRFSPFGDSANLDAR